MNLTIFINIFLCYIGVNSLIMIIEANKKENRLSILLKMFANYSSCGC